MKPKTQGYAYLRPIIIFLGLMLTFYALHFTRVRDEGNGTWGGSGSGITFTMKEAAAKEIQGALANNLTVQSTQVNTSNLDYLISALEECFTKPFYCDGLILTHAVVPILVVWGIVAMWAFLYVNRRNLYHQDAPGKEAGSSKFNQNFKGFAEKYTADYTEEEQEDGLPDPNIILADRLKLSMNSRATRRNLNVLVVGGSGTGKTYGLIKPNLAQMNCSFIVTDPSGEILNATGVMLMEHGYTIKLFSISDMAHSNVYNPLDYIYDENGEVSQEKVQILVSAFIENSNGKKNSGGDKFWEKSEAAFMTFAVLYLARFCSKEDRNMYNILKLAQCGHTDESSSSSETLLDKIVADARAQDPEAKCFTSYDSFKIAPAKTANSILISLAVDLNLFSADAVRNMTSTSYVCTRNADGSIRDYIRDKNGDVIRDSNNLDLQTIGDTKTVLFVNIPQANSAYNFLIAMMYSQLFNELYSRAEKVSMNRYHIYDKYGEVISSQYRTEQEAEKMIELYSNAVVKTDNSDGTERFFIYNKAAGKRYTLPDKAVKRSTYGYIKEVYSKQVGEDLIKRYKDEATVKTLNDPRLPVHTRFLLDEFANIGRIPDFDKMLSTMRKYEISATIILQSLAQVKEIYDKLWEVMVGNCDTIIFLGSSEMETAKYVSEKLGKTTIRTMDESQSKSGTGGSISNSFKKQARDLLDPSEVTKIENNDCIVMLRGEDPFYVPKYDWKHHPNYEQSGDANHSRYIKADYLEEHFKCWNKKKPGSGEDEIEEENKDIIENQTLPTANRDDLQTTSTQFQNLEELAKGNGETEEEFKENVKNAIPVDQEIYHDPGELLCDDEDSSSSYLNSIDNQNAKCEKTDDTDPESDGDAWVFESPVDV